MWRSALIVIAALLPLINASGVRADVTVSEQSVTVPEKLRVSGGPEGWRATPHYRVHKAAAAPSGVRPEYITGQGYEPSQILGAYGISGTGAGQTVAIVDACGSPSIAADLAQFSSAYGLPAATLNIIPISGQYNDCQPDSANAVGWGLETSLDVEWVHALAPEATIDLVVAPSDYFSDLFTAVQFAAQTVHAQVVSMSWGGTEFSYEKYYDYIFENPGTVFIASIGDAGSGTEYPAVSPNVVAVGGTSLYLNNGTGTLKFPEVAWEDSGGGPSQFEAKPLYQTEFGIPGTLKRSIPDVAFEGDPYTGVLVYDSNYDPSSGNLWLVGGTSLSAQCWAAIIALADQGRAAAHLAPLTDGHNALYQLAVSRKRYNAYGFYRDITWGYNGNYAATRGYDFVTGLGSPMSGSLVPNLAVWQ
jgi:subtilase family serine protease